MADKSTRKQIIINADDFGYSDERNKGIVESFVSGVVSSASLLVNGSSTRQAIRLAKENVIPLGLHLNLTEGVPIRKVRDTLTDESGFLRGKMGFREALRNGKIDKAEIEMELSAQLEWFHQNVGSPPTHVDGHQHIHVVPQVSRIFAGVLQRSGVLKTRLPTERNLEGCPWITDARRAFYSSVIDQAKEAKQLFNPFGIRYPCEFIGLSTMGKEMTLKHIQQSINQAFSSQDDSGAEDSLHKIQGQCSQENTGCKHEGTKTCEFMVHPGYKSRAHCGGCGQGPDGFACSDDREHELGILTSQSLKDFFEKENFEVISFREL